MSSQEMERLEPIIAEDRESRPPCCVSTHRSHVVDICISPTFLDHREATLFYNTPRVFCKSRWTPRLVAATVLDSLHVEWLQKGEAPCRLAPYRLGSHVVSPSVNGLRGSARAICFF